MSYTVQELQNDAMRKVKCSESSDFLSLVNEASRKLLSKVDPLETKVTDYLEYGVFSGISRYYVPDDLKNKKIIDIRRQIGRTFLSDFAQTSNRTFDKYYSTAPGLVLNHFTIEHDRGRRYLRFSDTCQGKTLCITPCDDISNWNVYGSINNLTLDKFNRLQGNGSLRFDINSNTFGAIENISLVPMNLSDYQQVGSLILSMFSSKLHAIQSVKLIWGSSATDYYSFTVTAPHNYTDFVDEWQQLKFPFDKMTVVGTPNAEAISRIRIEFVTDGTPIYDMRIDSINAHIGQLYQITYYSDWIFRNPETLTFKERTDSLSDEIILDGDAYQILLTEVSILLSEEVRDDINQQTLFKQELKNMYDAFNQDHKSEYEVPIEYWYKSNPQIGRYGYGFGGGFYGNHGWYGGYYW